MKRSAIEHYLHHNQGSAFVYYSNYNSSQEVGNASQDACYFCHIRMQIIEVIHSIALPHVIHSNKIPVQNFNLEPFPIQYQDCAREFHSSITI